jgi:hypothetical protein
LKEALNALYQCPVMPKQSPKMFITVILIILHQKSCLGCCGCGLAGTVMADTMEDRINTCNMDNGRVQN